MGELQMVVPNLPDNIDVEDLRLYFNNMQKSGGEGVKKIDIKEERGLKFAVLWFSDVTVVKSVLEGKHAINDTRLQAVSWDNWTAYRDIYLFNQTTVSETGTSSHANLQNTIQRWLCSDQQFSDQQFSDCSTGQSQATGYDLERIVCDVSATSDVIYTNPNSRPEELYEYINRNGPVHDSQQSRVYDNVVPAEGVYFEPIGDSVDIPLSQGVASGNYIDMEPIHRDRRTCKSDDIVRTVNPISCSGKVSCTLSCPSFIVQYVQERQFATRIDCTVRFNTNLKQIIFEGPQDGVDEIIQSCETVIGRIKYRRLSVSESGKRLLGKNDKRAKVEESLREDDPSARIYEDTNDFGIIVYDRTDSQLDDLIRKAQPYYASKRSIPICSKAQGFTQTHKWIEMLEECETNNMVVITVGSKIEVEGYYDDVTKVHDLLYDAIAQYSEKLSRGTTKTVPLKRGVYRLLEKAKQLVYNEIHSSEGTSGIKVTFQRRNNECKLILTGSNDSAVQQAAQRVTKFAKQKVIYKTVAFHNQIQCIENYCTVDPIGKSILSDIEKESTCAVEVTMSNKKNSRSSRRDDADTSKSLVEICKGCIEKFNKADVLVNSIATDSRNFAECGAVSKAFHSAGGRDLEKEIRGKLPIKLGEVEATASHGDIEGKLLLHAGIRDWEGPEVLGDVIDKCMSLAATQGFRSIAFPTIGCGDLKYPPYQVYTCIQEHAEKHPRLSVYIVAFDDHLYGAFTDYAKGRADKIHGSEPQYTTVTFHVNAFSENSASKAVSSIKKLIKESIIEEKISANDGFSHVQQDIAELREKLVDIHIDGRAKIVRVSGERKSVMAVKDKIQKIIKRPSCQE